MSLEASYSTTIVIPRTQMVTYGGNLRESPCIEILTLAMTKVVKDRGGKLDASYTDNEGVSSNCILSARTSDFPRGVGAVVESDGRIKFRYDAYGDNRGIGKAICDQISQNYNVIAVMRAQKRLGFNVRIEERKLSDSQKVVTIMGVR